MASVDISPLPHTVEIPCFSQPATTNSKPADAIQIAQDWIDKLSRLSEPDADVALILSPLFHIECWWRDLLALSWDFRSIHGADNVIKYVKEHITNSKLCKFKLRNMGAFAPSVLQLSESLEWVQSMYDFETEISSGSGMLRLMKGTDGVWKAFTFSTMLQQLKDYPERIGLLRPRG